MTLLSRICLTSLVLLAAFSLAQNTAPSVTVNGGTFIGEQLNQTTRFLGIRFAHPPVGDLRFRLPQPIASYSGTYTATQFGSACTQRRFTLPFLTGIPAEVVEFILNDVLKLTVPGSEDCLTLNVWKPSNADANSKLPVAVWIYGGGFQIGNAASYNGAKLVERSLKLSKPLMFVSMNYRLGGFGFLASKEVRDAGVGNLGIQDQRTALRWVRKHISAFGGDPEKVTIFGESAGAISVSMHMIANNGDHEGLFRGAFMQSGAPIPTGGLEKAQGYYDDIVKSTGCAGAVDTLQCLRTVPYAKLKDAIEDTPSIVDYQSIRLAYLPREDGVFITQPPLKLVEAGKVANVPYVTGNCDDEGTVFSIATLNASTNSHFRSWLGNSFFPGLSTQNIDRAMELYPSNPIFGSPFDTGLGNAITPQFKRFAAIQGDGVFQAPRRWLLQNTAHRQNAWAYLSTHQKLMPLIGASHTSINTFNAGELQDHLIRFVTKLDPNPGGLFSFHWPKYTPESKTMLVYQDHLLPIFRLGTRKDDFRQTEMEFLINVTLKNPV